MAKEPLGLNILSFLRGDNFICVNRLLAQKIGLLETIFLSDLCSKFEYHRDRNELTTIKGVEGYFYACIDDMQTRTTLCRTSQDTCIKRLNLLGLVSYVIKGIPPKRYFKINIDKILEIFGVKENSPNLLIPANQFADSDKLICPNQANQCAENSKSYTKEEETRKKRPEVKKELSLSLSFGSNVKLTQEDYDSLCSQHTKAKVDEYIEKINDWSEASGKKPYKCYKAALRMWIKRDAGNPAPGVSRFPPKKEDWPRICRQKAEEFVKKNNCPWVKVEQIYVTNYRIMDINRRNKTEIDLRTANPEEMDALLERLAKYAS